MRLTRDELERRLGDWEFALEEARDWVAAMPHEENTELKDEDGLGKG